MKTLIGTVTSTSMTKTAVVTVESRWQHPVYKKTVKRTKKYLVDDPQSVSIGDRVSIRPCRPLSKRKKWTINQVIK